MLNHYGDNPEDEINNSGFKNEEEEDDEEDDVENENEVEDDDDDGISFEKYVELRTKMDPCGDDKEAYDKILESEGYTKEDWNFYDRVWTVEMANPERLNRFSELYAQYTKKN